MVVTRIPVRFHAAITFLTARLSVSGSGVTISLCPSNKSANAARAPLFSGPGDRMRRHEARERVTEITPCMSDYVALCAARIGDYGVCFECGAICASTAAVWPSGTAISTRSAPLTAAPGSVSISSLARRRAASKLTPASAHPYDALDRLFALERERERAADQPDAEYNELADGAAARDATLHLIFFRPREMPSAPRNRSFSAVEPMVTRRYSGMP